MLLTQLLNLGSCPASFSCRVAIKVESSMGDIYSWDSPTGGSVAEGRCGTELSKRWVLLRFYCINICVIRKLMGLTIEANSLLYMINIVSTGESYWLLRINCSTIWAKVACVAFYLIYPVKSSLNRIAFYFVRGTTATGCTFSMSSCEL